jgi:hypothetical protein
MTWDGEIEAATLDQFRQGQDGRMHMIEADAGGIVARMQRIDPNLHLRYSEGGDHYVVYWKDPQTQKEELVATYQELDQRIAADLERMEHMQKQPGYSFADELDKKDAEAEKAGEEARRDAMAESAEKLHYALRKDKNMLGQRVFITKGLKE